MSARTGLGHVARGCSRFEGRGPHRGFLHQTGQYLKAFKNQNWIQIEKRNNWIQKESLEIAVTCCNLKAFDVETTGFEPATS
jgi:hypothetical protein